MPEPQVYRILIVEDCLDSLELLKQIVRQKGYGVYTAVDGNSALRLAKQLLPDLILLDILLPDVDGYEICRQMKTEDKTRDIPILFISALDEVQSVVHGFDVGGVDYITKPFKSEEVLARLHTHLILQDTQKRLQKNNTQLQDEIYERKQAEADLQQRNRELSLLNRAAQVFSSSLELDHVLKTVLEEIQDVFNVDSTSLWLLMGEERELVCMEATGPGSERVLNWRLAFGQGIAGWAVQHCESVNVADTWKDSRHFKGVEAETHVPVRSILSIPLRVKGEVIGALSLVDPQVKRFTQSDLIMLEPIAAAAASAIDNARLYTTAQQEISERKRAETALRMAHNEVQEKNVQLQALNAAKDKFFSIISHDLRSPFSALLGFAHLLKENLSNYTQEQLKIRLEKLYLSAERLYALLENLLTWSRIQRGILEYKPRNLNIQEVIVDIVELFLSEAERKDVTLVNHVPNKMWVYGDPYMLETVVRNLISNGLKFTPEGGAIEITAVQDDRGVEIQIADTGCGMSPEDISKLFRIDVQYTHPGTNGERGSGLGLILCQELLERNQGTIRVESEIGRGTTFFFRLPLPYDEDKLAMETAKPVKAQ